jgi:hypothetical protein
MAKPSLGLSLKVVNIRDIKGLFGPCPMTPHPPCGGDCSYASRMAKDRKMHNCLSLFNLSADLKR